MGGLWVFGEGFLSLAAEAAGGAECVRFCKDEREGRDRGERTAVPAPNSSSLCPPSPALRLSGPPGLRARPVRRGRHCTARHGYRRDPISRARYSGRGQPVPRRRAVPCRAMPDHAGPCCAGPCHAEPCRAGPGSLGSFQHLDSGAGLGRRRGAGGSWRARGGLGAASALWLSAVTGSVPQGMGGTAKRGLGCRAMGGAGPAVPPEKRFPGPGEEWGAR